MLNILQNWVIKIRTTHKLRGVLLTAGSLFFGRVVTACVQFIMVRLLLEYFGVEIYGVWIAITALAVILQGTDFGLSSAMVNVVSVTAHFEDKEELRNYLKKIYKLLLYIGLCTFMIGMLLSCLHGWRQWLHIPLYISDESLRYAILATSFIFSIQIPANANQQIWLGMQKGVFNGFFFALSAVLNVSAVALCIKFGAELHWIVVASASGLIIAQLVSTMLMFSNLKIRMKEVLKISLTMSEILEFIRSGRSFMIVHLCTLLSTNLDVLIVSHFLGSIEAAKYSVVKQLFSIPTAVFSLFFLGLWPIIARAKAEGNDQWINRNFYKTLKISIGAACMAAMGLYFSSEYLIDLWTRSMIKPDHELILGFSLWVILTGVGVSLATYMNGMGAIEFQAKFSFLFAILNVLTSLILVNVIGVSGPIWGSVAVTTVYYVVCLKRIKWMMDEKNI